MGRTGEREGESEKALAPQPRYYNGIARRYSVFPAPAAAAASVFHHAYRYIRGKRETRAGDAPCRAHTHATDRERKRKHPASLARRLFDNLRADTISRLGIPMVYIRGICVAARAG